MSFLSPWFLLGALAVAGPVAFHLMRRAARRRIVFGSLMFLRTTPPKAARRWRIEHFWLLVLRCICLALLAAGFARPFIAKDIVLTAPAAPSRRTVLMIDTSASMRREGFWDQARSVAESYLKKASPGDELAMMAFDRRSRGLLSFAEWTACAPDRRAGLGLERLAAVAPGWMGTQLGAALTTAAASLSADAAPGQEPQRLEIVLITDLQEGARLDGLQGFDWPAGVTVVVERVEGPLRANAGIEVLNESAAAGGAETAPRVRVVNARDSTREKFQARWFAGTEAIGQPAEIYLAPGQTRVFAAPIIPPGSSPDRLRLSGDDAPFGNQAFYAAPQVERAKIAWLGRDSAEDPQSLLYYAERAFPKTPRRVVEIVRPAESTPAAAGLLAGASLAIIPGELTEEETPTVRDWIASGKTALIVLTNAGSGAAFSALLGQPVGEVSEACGDFALLGKIDFAHPLFAPFADPRYSDFSRIHFWKHRRFEMPAVANARVLASFDDASPALAQFPLGKGTLLALASGWNPQESQFAVSSKFPPFLNTLLDWSGPAAAARFQFTTGDAIPAPAPGLEVRWRKPDGTTASLPPGTAFIDTEEPGIYTAAFGALELRFAVNPPLDESRTAPMAPDALARLGAPVGTPGGAPVAATAERLRHLKEAEIENRQKLWRWLIAATLAAVLGEIMLGGWLARRANAAEAAP